MSKLIENIDRLAAMIKNEVRSGANSAARVGGLFEEIAAELKSKSDTAQTEKGLAKKLDKDGDGKDVTVTFVEAATRENIASGEKAATRWGKVRKWFLDLKAVAFTGKAADLEQDANNRLVTDTEKTSWSDKYTTAQTYVRTEIDSKDAAALQAAKEYAAAKIAEVVNSAPGTLDTLQELATALGNDPNFATSIMALIGGKADGVHGHAISEVSNLQNELNGKLSITREEHYIGVRTPGREPGQFYEFWDGTSGYADIHAGEFYANKKKVWHTGNFNPDEKLNVGGGTLTGVLNIKPTHTSGIQTGMILYDAGTGGSEGLKIIWSSTDFPENGSIVAKNDGMYFASIGKFYANGKEIATIDQLNLKADSNHNHSGVYAPVHDHPYAASGHNHDGVYAAANHTHQNKILCTGKVTSDGRPIFITPGFTVNRIDKGVYKIQHAIGSTNYGFTGNGFWYPESRATFVGMRLCTNTYCEVCNYWGSDGFHDSEFSFTIFGQ